MLLSIRGMRGATKLMPKARKKTVKSIEKSALLILCTISNGLWIIKGFRQKPAWPRSFTLYRQALSKYNNIIKLAILVLGNSPLRSDVYKLCLQSLRDR